MNVLFVTTVSGTMGFFVDHIKMLISEGHDVELACRCTDTAVEQKYRELNCPIHDICFSRAPLSRDNLKALKALKKLVCSGNYDIVHTHTPIASACVRFACRKLRKKGLKVLYTAHGFHFFKGALLRNWLLYYPIEWICAHWTNVLITINHEDYERAKNNMHAGKVKYLPGVGVDIDKFRNTMIDRVAKRKEVGVPGNAIILLSVGELNKNKNHETAIKAIAGLNRKDIYLVIAGKGKLQEYLKKIAKDLGIDHRVYFIGFRTDVAELYKMADAFIHPSFREGLPVSVMEAMASGLPVVCSRIRGNVDLIDEHGGCLFNPASISDCRSAIEKLLSSNSTAMGIHNSEKVRFFSVDTVIKQIKSLYENA